MKYILTGMVSMFYLVSVMCQDTQYSIPASPAYQIKKTSSIFNISERSEKWDAQLKSYVPSANKSMLSQEELTRLKDEANLITKEVNLSRGLAQAPKLNINFEGNRGTGSVPPDNTIAVSDNGFIITSINSNIIFTRADGNVTYNAGLADFFVDLGLGSFFDPKVLFDAVEKKFIVVALSGNKANTSSVAVAFSQTEDPSMGWNFYKLKGDILSEGVWFDYPNIGVSSQDLFIGGNMFTDENSFRYSSIYQIDKHTGFSGEALDVVHYTKMKATGTGQNLFNMTPCPSGWNDNLENKMGFLTNDNRGGTVMIYGEIQGNIASQPSFKIIHTLTTGQYAPPQDATMKGSTDKLETFDCRIMYGINLNDIVHFVYKVSGNQYAAINYSRLNLKTKKIYHTILQESGMHISYPSIVAFGDHPDDGKVLINYLRSSEEIFPEQAAIICQGQDNVFEFSDPVIVKKGDNFVAALDGNVERWGDYTSVSRRYSNAQPEVWSFGCFGRSRFGSWTGQFIREDDHFYDFFANKTVLNPGDTITFSNIGTDTLTEVQYTLESARYLEGFDVFHQAAYDTLGSYNVSMTGINADGDTIRMTKKDFIHVVPVVFAPTADFIADRTNIFEGDSVQFSDLTINEPKRWKWSFSGASPNASELQNPKVLYTKKGSFAVVLNAKNTAGEDVEIKQKYIVVSPKPIAPIADFSASATSINVGDSIQLTDLSTNNPTAWQWIVSNETDSDTLTVQNPIIKFDSFGIYDVVLTASNIAGSDTIKKEKYITVGEVSTKQVSWIVEDNIYPNPIQNGRLTYTFTLLNDAYMDCQILNMQGQVIKNLVSKHMKAGKAELSFEVEQLQSGQFTLMMVDKNTQRKVFKPFTVIKG